MKDETRISKKRKWRALLLIAVSICLGVLVLEIYDKLSAKAALAKAEEYREEQRAANRPVDVEELASLWSQKNSFNRVTEPHIKSFLLASKTDEVAEQQIVDSLLNKPSKGETICFAPLIGLTDPSDLSRTDVISRFKSAFMEAIRQVDSADSNSERQKQLVNLFSYLPFFSDYCCGWIDLLSEALIRSSLRETNIQVLQNDPLALGINELSAIRRSNRIDNRLALRYKNALLFERTFATGFTELVVALKQSKPIKRLPIYAGDEAALTEGITAVHRAFESAHLSQDDTWNFLGNLRTEKQLTLGLEEIGEGSWNPLHSDIYDFMLLFGYQIQGISETLEIERRSSLCFDLYLAGHQVHLRSNVYPASIRNISDDLLSPEAKRNLATIDARIEGTNPFRISFDHIDGSPTHLPE